MNVQRWTGIVQTSESGGFVAYGDYLELQKENERLRELLGNSSDSHTHLCIACGHAYTANCDSKTEDCPVCGCDGTKQDE